MSEDGIIDIHTHIGSIKSWSPLIKGFIKVSLVNLLEYMNEKQIAAAWLLPLPGKIEPDSNIVSTETVLKLCKKYPHRLIPFCAIDPRAPGAEKILEKYYRKGCRGLGEFKVNLPVNDPKSVKLYEKAGELEMPVLIHMDNKFNPDIYKLEEVLEKCSHTIFILHGPGWWKHISADAPQDIDYPAGKIKPGGYIEKLLSRYDNIYADLSAKSGLNAITRDIDYAKTFLERFSSKVLFGTDFPCIDIDATQFGVNNKHLSALKELNLSKKALKNILYENAFKLVNI